MCIFICPQTPGIPGPDELVHGSAICRCPRFVEQLAAGHNPKLVDTRLLAHLRKLGRTYPMPPEPTQARSDLSHVTGTDDRLECCICMAADAVYKWSNCSHSGSPLVCLRCRNLVNSRSGDEASACPICRTKGDLVKVGLQEHQQTNKKKQPWGRPIKGTGNRRRR